MYLEVDDGMVTDLRIAGQGCSISQSSASMMSAAVKGRPIEEARRLIRSFKAMMSIHEHSLSGEEGGEARLRRGRDDQARGPRRARRPSGSGQVPGPHQVRDALVEHLSQGLDEIAAGVPPQL